MAKPSRFVRSEMPPLVTGSRVPPLKNDGFWPLFHVTPPSRKNATSTGSGPYIRSAHAERPQQRESELDVADQHAAADQPIERRARRRSTRIRRAERIDAVAAHELGIAHESGISRWSSPARTIAAVVQAAHGNRVEPRRHEVVPVVGQRGRELQVAEGRRDLEARALSGDRTRRAEERAVGDERRADRRHIQRVGKRRRHWSFVEHAAGALRDVVVRICSLERRARESAAELDARVWLNG